jgi:hypothetical protein
MAKVKIYLAPGETTQDAEDSLLKALNHHNSGDVHSSHSFQDPAMIAVADRMESTHKKIYQDMLTEIFEELDKDYLKNGNQ